MYISQSYNKNKTKKSPNMGLITERYIKVTYMYTKRALNHYCFFLPLKNRTHIEQCKMKYKTFTCKKISYCHILHMYSKSPHMFILRESCKHVSYYASFPQKGKKKILKIYNTLKYTKLV